MPNAQDNLPGDGNSIEEVVDEAHIVDESVHVTGAQHEQGGQTLREEKERRVRERICQCLSEYHETQKVTYL